MKRLLKEIYRKAPFKKQFFTLLKKFWVPPPHIYKHLYFNGDFTVHITDQESFRIRHYGFVVENEIFWEGITGGWEKISSGLWIALSRRSEVILDIGANTGVYSLVSKAVQPSARVFAFEPVNRVYTKLVENVRLNEFDIVCVEKAASDFNGEAVIYDAPSEHVYSVTVNKNMMADPDSSIKTKIRTVALQTFIEEHRLSRIDLVKIDVETHEPEVLKGFGPYLQIFRPTILIEILTEEVAEQVNGLIEGLDYLYFNIDELKGIRQTDRIMKSDYFNYLLCSRETAAFLKSENIHL